MLKEKTERDHTVTDFEPPDHWEELRDAEGNVMEGCYRTIPAPISDDLEYE